MSKMRGERKLEVCFFHLSVFRAGGHEFPVMVDGNLLDGALVVDHCKRLAAGKPA